MIFRKKSKSQQIKIRKKSRPTKSRAVKKQQSFRKQATPFLSLMIILITLFSVVFLKMEVRRLGYSVLKEARSYKALKDQYRLKQMKYAKAISSGRIEKVAQASLPLERASYGQVIQLSGQKIALKQ